MKNPKISVIIPVYNGEKTLERCLNSVLKQNYKNYEVIPVDNNSTDNSKRIIEDFQKKDKRVKYALETVQGRGAARNCGVNLAQGEIIVMIDQDCVAPKNWIDGLIKPILNENENASLGFQTDIIKNYWTKSIQKRDAEFFNRVNDGVYIRNIDPKNFAIKSQIMKKYQFDTKLYSGDDVDLFLRLWKDNIKIRFVPDIKVGHSHQDSLIKVIKSEFERAYWMMKIYKKHKNNPIRDKETLFSSISLKNFISFPFWMALQFVKNPISESFFKLISETSWRMGLLKAIISRKINFIYL